MATHKFTFLFDWQSRAGWTETWYKNTSGTPGATALTDFARGHSSQRAKVLTAAATVIACRISDVTQPRKVTLVRLGDKGALGAGLVFDNIQPDVVNIAQLVSFNSSGEQPRYFLQRGLDDRDVVDGKITFAENGQAKYNRYWQWLVDNDWAMRDYTKGPQLVVETVGGVDRSLTLSVAPGWAINDVILVKSQTVGNGLKMNWQGKVEAVNGATVTLKGYRFGSALGGRAWKLTATYPDLLDYGIPAPNWARTRQTGRPFFLPRGRAPKRK